HRMHLAGAVLIKDNHLALMGEGGVREAVRRAGEAHPDLTVEVEVETFAQLEEALAAAPDIILLDNMTPEQVREAARMARESADEPPQLEASGGIDLSNVQAYAEAGADRISIGALTHSAPALDLALEITPDRGRGPN
ncbi:MAG: nicotinate-nucleotide diphosphorylase (carboxylating), partial [Candidatus Brocadiia bacterium]